MRSWFPWRFLLRRLARGRGFIDPFDFLARLRQFAQPSEVNEPIELLRAGVAFHARGLINTKVFQFNLDWVWPWWVTRQFDPADPSFLPRAFSFSHVNLTHRNWTALGVPDFPVYPIVDPRGAVMPFPDGWSLDWWFIPQDGTPLFPSRMERCVQSLDLSSGLAVVTRHVQDGVRLVCRAEVKLADVSEGSPHLALACTVDALQDGRLVLALRPANPEGVCFVDTVRVEADSLLVNGGAAVLFERRPDEFYASTHATGDLSCCLDAAAPMEREFACPAGLVSAGAGFHTCGGGQLTARARVPLSTPGRAHGVAERNKVAISTPDDVWGAALECVPTLEIPDGHWSFLYEAAVRTLILLSPDDIYPGPYTYRRFWFRDACLIMHGLLALNLDRRVARALARFPGRQRHDGYFHSQEGEWDANGEVLWIADVFERTSNSSLSDDVLGSCTRGARWISRKRKRVHGGRHHGLLPAGFSAEHLGPNDFYYWDDFWGVAGLRGASALHARRGNDPLAQEFAEEADAFLRDINQSLAALPEEVACRGIPASPYRRMDSGAIGSLVADYPLQLEGVDVAALRSTADWLWRHCRHDGGFFQDMIHSGVNAYLTLALAQTFLRGSDERYLGLVESVASLASSTGQWPEAIHPITRGGCMGDGQHAWAAAEWVRMMRALFVREEVGCLVVGSGLPSRWFDRLKRIRFGPTATTWGPVTVCFEPRGDSWHVRVDGEWRGTAPKLRVSAPAFESRAIEPGAPGCVLERVG